MIDPERKEQLHEQMEAIREQKERRKGWMERRFGCLGSTLIWLVLAAVISTAIYTFFDALESPWAYSFFGTRPTLVGEWTGAFTTPSGMRGVVHVSLQHPYHEPSNNGGGTRWLEGTAESCIGSKAIQSYATYGRPNTAGSDIPLEFTQVAPYVPGYIVQSTRGSWSGEQLTLSGVLGHILDTANTTIVGGSDINQSRSVTIVFRKGTLADFTAACETLGP
jgi:hypothetical protein